MIFLENELLSKNVTCYSMVQGTILIGQPYTKKSWVFRTSIVESENLKRANSHLLISYRRRKGIRYLFSFRLLHSYPAYNDLVVKDVFYWDLSQLKK